MIQVHKTRISLLTFLVFMLISLAAGQTYEFNNCGAEGRYGPNSGDCNYGGENSVSIVGDGIQEWNVPETSKYLIRAEGASNYQQRDGGWGAIIAGKFNLNQGENLRILVGQVATGDTLGSGTGGTFVTDSSNNPLLVAGGGGGGHGYRDQISYPASVSGQMGTSGGDAIDGGNGGVDGDRGYDGNQGDGGGGAGFNVDGVASGGYSATGPESFTSGGVGALRSDYGEATGGFGGGGHLGNSHGAGGGGYSGGGGSHNNPYTGGGGGSFIHADVSNPATSDGTWSSTGSEPHNAYSGAVSDLNSWNKDSAGYVEITKCGGDFNNPSIQSTGYSDSQASSSSPASFDTDVGVNVDPSAPDGCGDTISGNSLSSCSVTATGEDGGSYSPSASVSGDTCEFTVENDGVSAWGPGEEVTLDITVTDDKGGTDTLTDTHTFVDTNVDEISVTNPSDNAGGVFGFDSGVDLEFSVTDYEAKATNKDLSVDILGDSLQNIGTQTVSNGDGSVSIEWERDGEFGDTGMYGFKRGNSYSWNVDVAYASSGTDIGGNSGDPWTFTVENPPNINGLTPTDGAQSSGLSVQELQNTISVNQMEVEFYLGSLGASSYNIQGTDTVLGSSGAASTNIMDAVQSGDEYEWFVGVDDGHSYIKYDSRVNTFTAPEVLRSATDLYVLPTERPSRDALNSLEAGDESYIWVDNGKLHWVDPATGTERWLQFAQSLSETTIPSGAIWVDGENLVWVGEDTTRYQHVGTNDGSSSLDPGTFWVDSSGYLRYVDGNGNERVMNG